MKNIFKQTALVSVCAIATASVHAQGTPGQVLNAAQPNSVSSGGVPLAGGTLHGPLGFANTAAATATTTQLQYLQGATGSVARSLTSKFQDHLSVADFGGGAGGDVSAAYQAAVNACSSTARCEIDVPGAAYILNTAPKWGTKSIFWNIDPSATFSGTQKTFPRMATNTEQVPVGPWIQSQSTVASPKGGGIAAFNIEMLQPASYTGQSVALYTGASGSNPSTSANVWSMNPLIQANVGAGGTYQDLELDVNNFSASALVKGISINGIGTHNPAVGLEIFRSDTSLWKYGIHLMNSVIGMKIETSGVNAVTGQGVVIGGASLIANTAIEAKQTANNDDTMILQRSTDTAPAGYLLRFVNAANSASLASVDVSGNLRVSNVAHSGQETDASYTFNTPTTGTTVTMAPGTETAIISPAKTLAALTLALPSCTSKYDGSIARYSSTQTITALTVSATSGTVSNAPTTLAAGTGHGMLCRGANTTWYPLY